MVPHQPAILIFCKKEFFSLIHGSSISQCWLVSESLGSTFLYLPRTGIRETNCHSQLFMRVLELKRRSPRVHGKHFTKEATCPDLRLTCVRISSLLTCGDLLLPPTEPLLFSQQTGQNETGRLLATSCLPRGLPASCAGMDGPWSQQKPECGSGRVTGRGMVW